MERLLLCRCQPFRGAGRGRSRGGLTGCGVTAEKPFNTWVPHGRLCSASLSRRQGSKNRGDKKKSKRCKAEGTGVPVRSPHCPSHQHCVWPPMSRIAPASAGLREHVAMQGRAPGTRGLWGEVLGGENGVWGEDAFLPRVGFGWGGDAGSGPRARSRESGMMWGERAIPGRGTGSPAFK